MWLFFYFLRISSSLLTLAICTCVVSTLSIRALSILIIVVLIHSLILNTLAISESSSSACSIPINYIYFLPFSVPYNFLLKAGCGDSGERS